LRSGLLRCVRAFPVEFGKNIAYDADGTTRCVGSGAKRKILCSMLRTADRGG
jgi:hypothetical protein